MKELNKARQITSYTWNILYGIPIPIASHKSCRYQHIYYLFDIEKTTKQKPMNTFVYGHIVDFLIRKGRNRVRKDDGRMKQKKKAKGRKKEVREVIEFEVKNDIDKDKEKERKTQTIERCIRKNR